MSLINKNNTKFAFFYVFSFINPNKHLRKILVFYSNVGQIYYGAGFFHLQSTALKN